MNKRLEKVKVFYASLLIIIIIISTSLYIDIQNEKKIYRFCNLYSIGNKISKVQSTLEIVQFNVAEPNKNTLLVSTKKIVPISKYFACEIKHAKGKITQLNFIKHSYVF